MVSKCGKLCFWPWEWPEIACLRPAPLPCSENPRSKMELLVLAGPTVFTAARDPRAAETIIVGEYRENTVKVNKASGFRVRNKEQDVMRCRREEEWRSRRRSTCWWGAQD